MHIELRPEDEAYVNERVKAGGFDSPAAVVHAALDAARAERRWLEQKLDDAINSGPATPLTADWKQEILDAARGKVQSKAS